MKVLIAGGGVAGGAAACLLGPDCVLVERQTGLHDKICGEFLSGEAIQYLRRLGLEPAALGAVPIRSVRLVHGGSTAMADLPFVALGLSRRTLDEALLVRAASLGAAVVRGHAVRGVADGVADVGGLGRFPGHAVFLATGKHDVRGARRVCGRAAQDLVGLKMHLAIDAHEQASLGGTVEIIMFRGGYGGLQPVEGGAVNLCVLLERRRFLEAGQNWAGVQALLQAESPHLARRLRGARPLFERPLSIYRVPYGYVHAPGPDDPDGLYRLGDQAGVIPSFSGDGVAMALHTAFAAHAALRSGGPCVYHARVRRAFAGQVARAGAIYRAGQFAPRMVLQAARIWPGALRWAARLTRVPESALREAR